jgi:RNA polymerase sigma factor (sigma-70 family)
MHQYSTEEVINAFRTTDSKILEQIYIHSFPTIRKLILLNKGSASDAEDIFADAMTLCFIKVRDDAGFKLTCSFDTYIYSICRNIWLNKLKHEKNYKEVFYDTNTLCAELADDYDLEAVNRNHQKHFLFLKHFAGISSVCQKVIRMFLDKISLAEIAKETGVTEKFAKKRNYECKKVLINRIMADTEYKNIVE